MMLVLGIILTGLGIFLLQWIARAASKPFIHRPLIFARPKAVWALHVAWVLLIGGGLVSFWQVNPTISLVLAGLYALIWGAGYFRGKKKSRAKRILKTYKKVRKAYPRLDEEEVLEKAAEKYLRQEGWEEHRLEATLPYITEYIQKEGEKREKIKALPKAIFLFGDPDERMRDIGSRLEGLSKEKEAINEAYKSVLGGNQAQGEPDLSENTLEQIRDFGLSPDELSGRQLAVFEEIEDHTKSNWGVRILYGLSSVFLLLAVSFLISLDFWGVVISTIISFGVWYVGYRLQARRLNKKFQEASIQEYVEEIREKDEDN